MPVADEPGALRVIRCEELRQEVSQAERSLPVRSIPQLGVGACKLCHVLQQFAQRRCTAPPPVTVAHAPLLHRAEDVSVRCVDEVCHERHNGMRPRDRARLAVKDRGSLVDQVPEHVAERAAPPPPVVQQGSARRSRAGHPDVSLGVVFGRGAVQCAGQEVSHLAHRYRRPARVHLMHRPVPRRAVQRLHEVWQVVRDVD